MKSSPPKCLEFVICMNLLSARRPSSSSYPAPLSSANASTSTVHLYLVAVRSIRLTTVSTLANEAQFESHMFS